jgi:cell division protein FtsL
MAASAQARASAAPARRRAGAAAAPRPSSSPAPARAPRSRPATHARAARLLTVFLIALTVLAVGRIALSFAVVQKTMATEVVATEQRRLVAENAQLAADVTRLSSMTRVRSIALSRLGLVPSTGVVYLSVGLERAAGDDAER